MLLTGIKFVLRLVKFRLLLGDYIILADIFFAAKKTAAKINTANILVSRSINRKKIPGEAEGEVQGLFSLYRQIFFIANIVNKFVYFISLQSNGHKINKCT